MSLTGFTDPTATPAQPANKVLFTSGSSVTINASAEAVFDAITDIAKYPEWNTWTPLFTFQEGVSELRPGIMLTLKTMMSETKDMNVPVELIELIRDPKLYRICWQGRVVPAWVLIAQRVQEVRPIEGNPQACQVKNWESMSGMGAYGVKWSGVPKDLNQRNVRYLEELKAYVEKQASQ